MDIVNYPLTQHFRNALFREHLMTTPALGSWSTVCRKLHPADVELALSATCHGISHRAETALNGTQLLNRFAGDLQVLRHELPFDDNTQAALQRVLLEDIHPLYRRTQVLHAVGLSSTGHGGTSEVLRATDKRSEDDLLSALSTSTAVALAARSQDDATRQALASAQVMFHQLELAEFPLTAVYSAALNEDAVYSVLRAKASGSTDIPDIAAPTFSKYHNFPWNCARILEMALWAASTAADHKVAKNSIMAMADFVRRNLGALAESFELLEPALTVERLLEMRRNAQGQPLCAVQP